jgi:hypothetical protein
LAGVQLAPATHALQLPLSQTSFHPQVVPFGKSEPVSSQTCVPLEQTVLPTRQSLAGVQNAPAVQGRQLPLSQTSFQPWKSGGDERLIQQSQALSAPRERRTPAD